MTDTRKIQIGGKGKEEKKATNVSDEGKGNREVERKYEINNRRNVRIGRRVEEGKDQVSDSHEEKRKQREK